MLDPNDTNSYWIQGLIHRELGNFREALQSNHQALKIDPHNIDATIELGQLHRKFGNLDQALACALESIKSNAADTTKACDLLTLTLQQQRNTINSNCFFFSSYAWLHCKHVMVGRGDVAGPAVLAALAVLAVHSSHGPRHEVWVLPDPFGRHGNVIGCGGTLF